MLKNLYYWLRRLVSHPQERGGRSAGYWHAKIRDAVLQAHVFDHGRVLDIGCGEGLFLRKALSRYPKAGFFGIDMSLEQLARARLAGETAHLAQADALQLAFRDGSFDAVVCINFFVNLASINALEAIMKELYRVCRPGGAVIFDIRNEQNLFVRLKYKYARAYDGTLQDLPLSAYRFDRVSSIMHSIGFTIKKTGTIGFPPGRHAPVIIIEAQKL